MTVQNFAVCGFDDFLLFCRVTVGKLVEDWSSCL